jgi:hypothetical protein
MTTATINAPKLIPVTVYWKGDNIAITAGSRTCKIDQTHFDEVSFSDDADAEYKRLAKERNGRAEFATAMTRDQMLLWAEIRDTLAKYVPPAVQPEAPAPGSMAELDAHIEAEIAETPAPAPAATASVLPSEDQILASVQTATTAPAAEATTARRKIKDETNRFIYEKVAEKSRVYGMTELEHKIRTLQETEKRLSKEVTIVSYDIPAVIRAVMPEVTGFLWAAGLFPLNESVFYGTNEVVEGEAMQSLFAYFKRLNARFKGVMYRDGRVWKEAQIKCDLIEMSERQRGTIKALASESLREMLVSTHASLIVGLHQATEEFKKASAARCFTEGPRAGQEKTEKDRIQEQRDHDNSFRTELRNAAEALNLAVDIAERYDADDNVTDLLEALRQVVISRRNSFNVECAKQEGRKGIDI